MIFTGWTCPKILPVSNNSSVRAGSNMVKSLEHDGPATQRDNGHPWVLRPSNVFWGYYACLKHVKLSQ